ncbi:hypothetical protein PHLCEN_2v1049 [Hermanssonia centrifuga]|uniref:Uncharacterized protein n=1 Tax=Hermanssonia centrifuga TaxID=98765 RepID=A0A2R6S4I0_9APHY|nr:hypothetical protein PHLCEN_2v1049 [Hermanssonia centrifuga]
MSSILSILFPWVLPLLSLAAFLLPQTYAALVNVTVDDAHPDPLTGISITYAPLNAWTLDSDCSTCVATPDGSQAYMGTWHDTTYLPEVGTVLSATFQFNGSALYVYCITAQSTSAPDGNSDMLFFLDGEPAGSYEHIAPGEPTYDYNVPVYSNPSIAPGFHTFVLQNGQTGGQASLALLDYIVYS